MNSKRTIRLLVIDPQNDFCDLPDEYLPTVCGSREAPALPVRGAHQDFLRASEMLAAGSGGIASIAVTLDSHNYIGIERSTFWRRPGEGEVVSGVVSLEDLKAGRVMPRSADHLERALRYVAEVEAMGKSLFVWPVHCEVGTWGHQIHREVLEAFHRWEAVSQRPTRKELKGLSPWTEHHGVFKADVLDEEDPGTGLNTSLLRHLHEGTDMLIVFGQAGSHCVPASVDELVAQSEASFASKIVLLTDAMSPVPGFEAAQDAFIKRMVAKGVQTASCADMAKELVANGAR